jgi:serine protease Do
MPENQEALSFWSRRRLLQFAGVAAAVTIVVALAVTLGVFAGEEAAQAQSAAQGSESVRATPLVPGAALPSQTAPSGEESPSAESAPPSAEAAPVVALSRVFADVSAQVKDAVVNISTEQVWTPEGTPFDEFFKRFFGGRIPEQRRRSVGSGVIISADGHILTNHHVVEGAEEIEVQLADGTSFEAKLLGSDPPTDLAVLDIESDDPLPVAPLGDSDRMVVGEWVLAIGNPFGVGQTVTAGIISATQRVIGQGPYDDFIQTDAAINPGNSGGPLLNLSGEVIGINSNIVSRTGGNMGVGFAIPSNMAADVYDQIVKTGGVTRGWLGVSIQPLTPELAESFGLDKTTKGALVSRLLGDDSPAAKAGLKPGDVIAEFAGQPIDSSNALSMAVAKVAPGKTVEVVYYRDGKRRTAHVTLGEREQSEPQAQGAPEEARGRLGIRGQTLTPQIASQIGTSSTSGVVVAAVEPGSAADDAGLRRGDIIHEANRKPVETMEDLRAAIADVKEGGTLLLRIERVQGGTSGFLYVPVRLD